MPAPGAQSTFDGNPNTSPATTTPYRPGSSDFNGLSLIDDSLYPPDNTMPSANLLNSEAATLIVACRMIPNAVVSVTYSGGNPQFDSFTATPTAVASHTAATTFTIQRTSGGAVSGDIFIFWPANTFPSPLARPRAHLNGTAPGGICADNATISGHTGVRIVAVNMSNAATDLPFTVEIM